MVARTAARPGGRIMSRGCVECGTHEGVRTYRARRLRSEPWARDIRVSLCDACLADRAGRWRWRWAIAGWMLRGRRSVA